MDLNTLSVFAMVAEVRSFSEAARRLKIPLATVSRRLADLEHKLGARLLERSTRTVRLTEIGAQVLEHAQRTAEVSEAIDNIVSNHLSSVTGLLRVAAPPGIYKPLVAPLIAAFQASYPDVRVQVLITERNVDQIPDGVDVFVQVAQSTDSSPTVRKLLSYRHQLVASPSYLEKHEPPLLPQDLAGHMLLAFAFWRWGSPTVWEFFHKNGRDTECLTFLPYLATNDFAGLTPALLAGTGIGDLPSIVQPELLEQGNLIEILPDWRFRPRELSLVCLMGRNIPRQVRVFREFAAQMAATLFPAPMI